MGLIAAVLITTTQVGFAGTQIQDTIDPRIAKQLKPVLKGPQIKFLPQAKILEAFKAKKISTDGKTLSGPIVFTPRNIYSSDNLYVEVDRVMTTSAIDNVWHVNHHNGFYLVYKPTDRKPFIVTLYGTAVGRGSAHTVTTARTRLFDAIGNMSSEVSFDHDQTIRAGDTLTIPVIVTSPDVTNTVRFFTTQDTFDVTAIEVRTLG